MPKRSAAKKRARAPDGPLTGDLPSVTLEARVWEWADPDGDWVVREARDDNVIIFNRQKPSHCDICDRLHDRDNTLFLVYDQQTDVLWRGCWKSDAENKTRRRIFCGFFYVL